MSDADLIRKYEPVLCFHPDEAYLPENARRMVMEAVRYEKSSGRELNRAFDPNMGFRERSVHLGRLKDKNKWSLVLPESDLRDVTTTVGGNKRHGLTAVKQAMRTRYGNRQVAATAAGSTPLYHARVVRKVDVQTAPYRGRYAIIQYYFFYIYNDSANQHQGDWDSSIEVCVPKGGGDVYVFYHQHHTSWLTKMLPPGHGSSLDGWITNWASRQNGAKWADKDELGEAYAFGTHPLAFVANGAHGAYPTPGTSFFVIDLGTIADWFGDRYIPFNMDERSWGVTVGPSALKADVVARAPDVPGVTAPEYIAWEKPKILDKQAWLTYGGLWGQRVPEYNGWGGSRGPRTKDMWKAKKDVPKRFEEDSEKRSGRYNRTNIPRSKILFNSHVLM